MTATTTGTTTGRLAERIRQVLALDPRADAIEFDGDWWTWGRVAELARAVANAVPGPGARCGILLRNSPEHVAAVLGVLLADGCVVTINPSLGSERVGADLAGLELELLVGAEADLTTHAGRYGGAVVALRPAGVSTGSTNEAGVSTGSTNEAGVSTGSTNEAGVSTGSTNEAGVSTGSTNEAGAASRLPGTAVLMLTSGTTGPPKRIELGADVLLRTFEGAKHYESGEMTVPKLRTGVAVVNSPLVHLSGVFRVLQCVLDGRSFVLLPRFEVSAWADAVRRHRPKTASLVPTALRMVLESDLTRDDLASLLSVTSGTAPLDPADAEAFHDRFGVPVLTSYAATEFGGGVAGWNLKDFQAFGATKRGSVGRAHAGCGLRIADPGADGVGLLEVRPAQFGADADWVRTTDLARIDDDGFLWIVGRADQTIIRGGFKVQPDTVRSALEKLDGVRAASVFGVPDERLGELPVALVELRDDASATSEELLAKVAPALARYEVPARLEIVSALPRTASGKVDLVAARAVVLSSVSTGSTSGPGSTSVHEES